MCLIKAVSCLSKLPIFSVRNIQYSNLNNTRVSYQDSFDLTYNSRPFLHNNVCFMEIDTNPDAKASTKQFIQNICGSDSEETSFPQGPVFSSDACWTEFRSFCLLSFFRLLINSRDIVARLRPGWSSLISVLSSWGLNQETTHTTMRHRLLKMVEDYKWHTLLQLLCHFWSCQRINAQRSAWQPLPSNQEKRESLLHPVPFPSLYSRLFLSTMSLFNPQSSFAFLFNVPHLLLSVMLHIGLFLWVSSFLKCTSPLLTLFSSLLPSPLSLSSLFWLSLSPSDAVCWANESQGN